MRGFLDWFFNRFRASNNFRLAVFWTITGTWLLANLIVFGFGSAMGFARGGEAQRYYNAYFHGRFVTDAGLPWHSPIGIFLGWSWSWLRWFFWFGWFQSLLWSICYTPWAFRDEIGRAWRRALRAVREQRGSPVTPAAQPAAATAITPPQAGVVPGSLREALIFFREVVSATVANIFTHRRA